MWVPKHLPLWMSENGYMQNCMLEMMGNHDAMECLNLETSQEHCPKGGFLWGMMKKAPPLAPSIWDTNTRPGSSLLTHLPLKNLMPEIWGVSGSQRCRSWCFSHTFLSCSPPRTRWCTPCSVPQRTVAWRSPWRTSNRRTCDPGDFLGVSVSFFKSDEELERLATPAPAFLESPRGQLCWFSIATNSEP